MLHKPTLSRAKKRAYHAFQIYERSKWTKSGTCKCYTCDRVLTFKQVQVGHWVVGHGNVVYINEDYVRPQDYYCNIQLSGNQGEFRDRLRKELGDKVVDKLIFEARMTKKITVQEYLDLEAKYIKLLEELR